MRKTTNETIKSVIQDWLAECETVEELNAKEKLIREEAKMQFWVLLSQMRRL